MIDVCKGDLFQILQNPHWQTQAIAHGCNSLGVMGAGFSGPIKKLYSPEMFSEYRKSCREGSLKPGDVHVWEEGGLPILYNLITQNNISTDRATAERIYSSCLGMFEHAVRVIRLQGYYSAKPFLEIHMPAIGCGLGGMKKPDVLAAILQAFEDSEARNSRSLQIYWWELE